MIHAAPLDWFPEECAINMTPEELHASVANFPPLTDIPRITRESEMARLNIRIQSVVDGVAVLNSSRPTADDVPARKRRGRKAKAVAPVASSDDDTELPLSEEDLDAMAAAEEEEED